MGFPNNFDAPIRYIQQHYEPEDRLCVALIKRENHGRGVIQQEFADARAICNPKYQAHLRTANAHGSDVYLTVNTILPGSRNRTKADIDQVRHLFVDVDEGGPEVVKAIFASDLPKPSAVIESSQDRFQILWRVNGFSKEQAEAAVRNISTRFGADQAVWDCARVLRVPGFRNTKREGKFYARLVSGERSAHILTLKDFPAFPKLERTVHHAHKINTPARHSRSEKDWAKVMTALERGVAPDEIKAQIEAERTGNKTQPHRYAEYTVEKAIAVFERKRGSLSPQHGAEEDVMNEQQNLKPVSQLTNQQLVAEDQQLHDHYTQLMERYNQAPANQRAEIRQEMEPVVNRERELRQEFLARFKPEISQDRVPEPQIGYSR